MNGQRTLKSTPDQPVLPTLNTQPLDPSCGSTPVRPATLLPESGFPEGQGQQDLRVGEIVWGLGFRVWGLGFRV